MAVTFRSKNQVIATSSTNPQTVTEPAGATSGDMLAFLAVADSGVSLAAPAGWTVPSGYGPTTVGAMMFVAGYIQRGGSAPSLSWVVSGASKYREIHIVCLQGAATITFDAASTTGSTGTAANHNPDASAVSAVAASSLCLIGGVNYAGSNPSWGAPSGYVLRTDNTAGNDAAMATKSLAASGSENPGAFTGEAVGVSAPYWDGFAMTFTDAGGGGGSRGLFLPSSINGIGIGGSFFRDPLQSAPRMTRRNHIYVPERMVA